MLTPPASAARGNRETLLQGGHVDRNLEREAGSEPIENAGGGRVGLLRHLLGPGIVGPHHLEDGADRQPAHGEPPRAVEERSPVDVPVLMFVKEIEQFLRKVGRLLALHDRSSSRDVAPFPDTQPQLIVAKAFNGSYPRGLKTASLQAYRVFSGRESKEER